MKRLVFALALGLFGLNASYVNATPFGDAVRDIDKGKVLILNHCRYLIKLNDPKAAPVSKSTDGMGGGVFFDDKYNPKENSHLVLTAKHVVVCSDKLPERFYDDDLGKESVKSFSVSQSIFIIFRGVSYAAGFGEYEINGDSNIDLAVLETILPQNANHYHNLLLPEDAEGYDLGTELIIRSFMPFPDDLFEDDHDGWISRLQFTHLENISSSGLLMQLSNSAYPGQSGSGVYLYRNGKLYLVGMMKMAASYQNGTADIPYDTSWATILKKEYFVPKKKP